MANERYVGTLEGKINECERMYLGKYHRTGKPIDGLGRPDLRYLRAPWMYNPLIYRPLGYYWDPPPAGGPPTQSILTLADLINTGLEFYVYLSVSSIRVSYDMIKENDKFTLTSPCPAIGLEEIECEIIDPADSSVKGHEHAFPGPIDNALKQHQYPYEMWWGWMNDGWNVLDLPIFLRIDNAAFRVWEEYFVDNNIQSNTFNISLKHAFPKDEKLHEESVDGIHYITIQPDATFFINMIPAFFSLQRNYGKPVRLLVGSDLHVAERNKTIETEHIPVDPSLYNNYNERARKLKEHALELWEEGKLDYVVLVGDLIDYAWKDSNDIEINLYPNRGFHQDPMPYGLGEFGVDLPNMLGQSVYLEEHWYDFVGDIVEDLTQADIPWLQPDYVPGARTILIDREGRDPDNLKRIWEVETKLREYSRYPEVSNWHTLKEILGPMTSCIPTFLVPGNHDRLIFGTNLQGVTEDEYNAFVRIIIDDVLEEDPDLLIRIAVNAMTIVAFMTPFDLDTMMSIARAIIVAAENLPELPELSSYLKHGLYYDEALRYDTHYRQLKSRSPSMDFNQLNFRSLLAALQSEGALAPINILRDVGAILPTGGSGLSGSLGFGGVEIPYSPDGKKINLVFFDNGPVYHLFKDQTPRDRGFYWADKGIHPAINWFKEKRNQESTLIAFMHAPPVSHYGPHGGNIQEDVQLRGPYDWEFPQTFYYGFRDFHEIFQPTFNDESPVKRPNPLLVLSGHSHLRHTYSVHGTSSTNPLDYTYDSGNMILDQLNNQPDLDAKRWWWYPNLNDPHSGHPYPGTGRVLCVNVGCVGPIPESDFQATGAVVPGDDPHFASKEDKQGYYIVEISDGIVSSIEWQKRWYRD